MKSLKATILFTIFFLLAGCATNPTPEPLPNTSLFSAKSSLQWVKELAPIANCVVKSNAFKTHIAKIEKFDYTNDSGLDVLAKLDKHPKCIISTYKTRNPFSKVIATTYNTNKTTLYLNLRRNPRAVKSMINTVVHECSHLFGYSHGTNSNVGKENSVPYKIGSIAQNYVDECSPK